MLLKASDSNSKETAGIPCSSKKIPLWLVLLDNIPTMLLFILGFLIIEKISLVLAILFAAYTIFSVVWFWAKICPYCHHYDTHACPCGYGVISSRFFRRKDNRSFRKVFSRNIGIQYPNWFVPFAVAIFLIITRYSMEILVITILFALVGFVIIPLISKLVGCRNCEIKNECPWMAANRVKQYHG